LVHRLEPALRGDAFADTFREVFEASMGLERLPADIRELILAGRRIRREVVLGYWAEILALEPDDLQGRIDGALDAIEAPVLAVFGRGPTPPEQERLARLPDAACEVWRDFGHFAHLVEPDRFAERLLAFVEHCTATPDRALA
jgi:pimeloyl-ACP methyl ester carboxylesterase